jgi:Family of unknown function (DUF6441)
MRVTAAIQGDLQALLKAELRGAERAVTGGVRAAANGLKADLRAQVTGAGLGQRLANTWRSRIYPEGGEQSLSTAGFVWSKAPNLIRLYNEGAIIRSRHGLYLATPMPAAGRFGDRRQKITPLLWERIHGMRLRFVYRQPGPSLLVADNVRLTARGRAAANIGRRQGASFTRLSGRTTVPLFILVPQVSVKKRLNVEGAAQKWIKGLPELVLRNWRA